TVDGIAGSIKSYRAGTCHRRHPVYFYQRRISDHIVSEIPSAALNVETCAGRICAESAGIGIIWAQRHRLKTITRRTARTDRYVNLKFVSFAWFVFGYRRAAVQQIHLGIRIESAARVTFRTKRIAARAKRRAGIIAGSAGDITQKKQRKTAQTKRS